MPPIARREPRGLPHHHPTVSVIIVSLNGASILGPCLDSLNKQTYPEELVEIILVDNASTDGTVAFIKEHYPKVRLLVNDTNVGFAPAVNQAARIANGDYLALLNNDAVADPNWIRAGAQYLQGHEEVGCVGSLIVRMDGTTVDYAGGSMSFYGMGFADYNDAHIDDVPPFAVRTFFASGGAMVTPTQVFLDAGGFDASYFAFFEDVDYGWRLWTLGLETHFVPQSKVFHEHHGTIKRFGYARERYLLERNALATIYKNYSDETFAKTFPASIILTMMRGLHDLPEDAAIPDMRITPDATNLDDERFPVTATTMAHLAAIRDFSLMLPELTKQREWIQSHRAMTDAQIMPLFKKALSGNVVGESYHQVFDTLLDALDLRKPLTYRNRVLIVTGDTIGAKMAGPAIRCWEMANVLAEAGLHVTLASMTPPTVSSPVFRAVGIDQAGGIDTLLKSSDVVIFQGFVMHHIPQIETCEIPVLVDLYDPFHIEALTQRKEELDWVRYASATSDVNIVNKQIVRGDFFVCASEKQRDLWLGHLATHGRINPATFDVDESLRSLIDVAPFGMPAQAPVHGEKRVLRGVVPGIEEDDFVLIWGGGIYNWFDPLTLIEAVAEVAKDHPRIKLWFMGNAHPNPDVPKMYMASQAYNLAQDLGVLGTHVLFNEGWIEYDTRADYLLEANVGVSTHYEHLETRYSYRTRILDYIWAALPMIVTGGDTLGDLAKERTLGVAVEAEVKQDIVDAIIKLMDDQAFYETCHSNLDAIRKEMTWDQTMRPIVRFCQHPQRAADTIGRRSQYLRSGLDSTTAGNQRDLKHYVERAFTLLGEEGVVSVAQKTARVLWSKVR